MALGVVFAIAALFRAYFDRLKSALVLSRVSRIANSEEQFPPHNLQKNLDNLE
jgi:hypothetical protein